jgi:hypothetical protein
MNSVYHNVLKSQPVTTNGWHSFYSCDPPSSFIIRGNFHDQLISINCSRVMPLASVVTLLWTFFQYKTWSDCKGLRYNVVNSVQLHQWQNRNTAHLYMQGMPSSLLTTASLGHNMFCDFVSTEILQRFPENTPVTLCIFLKVCKSSNCMGTSCTAVHQPAI